MSRDKKTRNKTNKSSSKPKQLKNVLKDIFSDLNNFSNNKKEVPVCDSEDDAAAALYKLWKKNHPTPEVYLNKQVVKSVLKDIKTTNKTCKFHRTCSEGYDSFRNLINWDSPMYVFSVMRSLIIHRDWQHLKDLILILMHHKVLYKNYLKEITHLYYLINGDSIDPGEIDEYYQLCFTNVGEGTKMRDFDIWHNEPE